MEGNSNGNRNEDLKAGSGEVENQFIETDGTLVNLANGDPNNPAFVSESILAAMGAAPTGNFSDELIKLKNLLERLGNGNSAKIYDELIGILTSRNFR